MRPLVVPRTLVACSLRVWVHFIGCALRAPHQTLTSVPGGEVQKNQFPTGFLVVYPSGASPDPLVGLLGGGLYYNKLFFLLLIFGLFPLIDLHKNNTVILRFVLKVQPVDLVSLFLFSFSFNCCCFLSLIYYS